MIKKSPFRRMAVYAARAADDKHGEHVVILDIQKLTAIADYMVVVTANSTPHARALSEEIEHVFTGAGVQVLHREGNRDTAWRVLDYGGVVVHIMHEQARMFYALDKLWRDARTVRWSKKSYEKK